MFKFTQAIVRNSKNNLGLFSKSRINNYSAAPTSVELKNHETIENTEVASKVKTTPLAVSKSNSIVAAAFASLSSSEKTGNDIQTPFTDEKIEKAKTVKDLLSISDGNGVSRRHALKVVSILADWSSNGKVKLSEFESDPRFIKLCKILTKGTYYSKANRVNPVSRNEDLSTIMSVTADDEAAKLVASITLPQMVKVMQTLALKKRRSTMLLRSLSYNITRSNEKLDLKQAADLLFSISVLNFPDENLLERIGNDILVSLNDNIKKSAVIGSIVTSLGLLKYKDTVGVLDALSGWMDTNHEVCRPQDVFGFFLTLAVLNYEPSNAEKIYKTLIPQVSATDATKPTIWLDFVWSLVLLNKATLEHVSSVLTETFINEIKDDNSLSISTQLKLLNVNAAADCLLKNYNGPKLDDASSIMETPLNRTKEKEEMVMSVLESLKNLMQTDAYIRSNVNSKMGFYIDAECVIDKKCNPIPLDKYSIEAGHIRVAFMINDYHDMTRGRVEATGINIFTGKLLKAKGYKIIQIPYSEYKIRDKLIHRVQCIESKLKSLAQS